MEHVRRHTVVDLHHAIVPTVSRYAFDPTPLFDQATEVSSGLFVLCPKDRVIHSCLHAFLEGVPSKALRDLYDISCLLRQHFANEPEIEALLSRSEELGVKELVRDAITASATIFMDEKPQNLSQATLRSQLLATAAFSTIGASAWTHRGTVAIGTLTLDEDALQAPDTASPSKNLGQICGKSIQHIT
jgi:hypothetical protein